MRGDEAAHGVPAVGVLVLVTISIRVVRVLFYGRTQCVRRNSAEVISFLWGNKLRSARSRRCWWTIHARFISELI